MPWKPVLRCCGILARLPQNVGGALGPIFKWEKPAINWDMYGV